MIELMATTAGDRHYYDPNSEEFSSISKNLAGLFPKVNPKQWAYISDPYYHEVYREQIVSAALADSPSYFFVMDERPYFCHRKFLLESKRIYDKHYYWTAPGVCSHPLPDNATPVATGKTVNVYGQPGDEDFSSYECVYFLCDSHREVENWASQPLTSKPVTHYAATFFGEDLIRVKSYCYDSLEANNSYGDWLRAWRMISAARGLEA